MVAANPGRIDINLFLCPAVRSDSIRLDPNDDKVCRHLGAVGAVPLPLLRRILRLGKGHWFLDVARPPSRDPPPGDRLP
eukprot:1191988-Prorocentrum_minimum.AAC.2